MSNNDIATIRTICFPIHDNKIILGMKLTGFGSGKYNGFGGKLKIGETKEQAAIRELEEESEIIVDESALDECAVIDFEFPFKHAFDQRVHVFIISQGPFNPKKTKEMEPFLFDVEKIPYTKMWDSDKLWLPSLLEGKKFYAKFLWKEDNETVSEFSMKFVDELNY